MRWILIALVSCGGDKGGAPEEADTGEIGACKVDSCVDSDASKGLDCCIEAHGYGVAEPTNLGTLAAGCEGGACDPARYLSEEAAVCAAQVCGLSPGIRSCSAWFQIGADHAAWTVENVTEVCEGNLCGSGDMVQIDAVTGECGGSGRWYN